MPARQVNNNVEWLRWRRDARTPRSPHIDLRRINVPSKSVHPPEYKAWQSMRQRCFNHKCDAYKDYGNRGITVCARWNESYANFLSDMGPRPSAKHSLDRIDNDGNYEPNNCRWATPIEQHNNTRYVCFLEHDGRRMSLSKWAREIGMDPATLYSRIREQKLPVSVALTAPLMRNRKKRTSVGS